MNPHRFLGVLPLLVCASIRLFAQSGDDVAALTLQRLNDLRDIQVPKEKSAFAALNQRMDATWSFVLKHRSVSLPIVETELKRAIAAETADQFFILDMAFLLITERGDDADPKLCLAALKRLDPAADIIRANSVELFHFVIKLGASQHETEGYLAEVDRIYLPNVAPLIFFREPHVVQLTPLDLACMVYGVAGDPAADHLCRLLPEAKERQATILKLLGAIGTETNVPAVKSAMESGDREIVQLGLNFMMQLGGPSGKKAVLDLNVAALDDETRRYLDEIKPKIEAMTYADLVAQLEKFGTATISDARLQGLLDTMEKRDGQDTETEPAAIVRSGLPVNRLIEQLKRIRARSFRRGTNHVFEDLPIFNTIINALQFRRAGG